ncbi:hypothetical protein LEM8419_01831 [Neolewinella maritima]|uniref:UspA domain-containing protein n=1 Tax=Neolewinella maritima TaxID=1383882 RepID=A0ABM9B181_9BACT|nr:universal stress protein [Neolewinella maritima]CAH1000697.1 hypothetical protein LEM8419_01831 [Neolewinella maritima]
MKKIIVPVDFSAASAATLRFANYLAGVTGLQLSAIFVYNPMVVSNRPDTPEERVEERRVLEEQLRLFVDKHVRNDPTGPPVEAVVGEGIPPVYIKWRTLDEDVVLVVMAGVGTGAGGHLDLFGSIATMVSQEGGCPVVLIPRDYGEQLMRDTTALFSNLHRSAEQRAA